MAGGRCAMRWISVIVVVACLAWMDACLYFKIQSFDDKARIHDKYDDDLYEQQTFNTSSTMMGHIEPLVNKFSFAFHGMSIKLIMTDPVDNYIMCPLSEMFADFCDLKHKFMYISADMISYAGVICALVAAKLVSKNSSTLHKLSFVFFQLRTWLDDLDGVVARARQGIFKHVSLTNTPGYVVDGLCDTIGFAAYIIGSYIYLRNNIEQFQVRRTDRQTTERYNLESITRVESSQKQHKRSSYEPLCQQEDLIGSENESYNSENDLDEMEEEEELEILCHDSSREVSPTINASKHEERDKHSPGINRTRLLLEQMRANMKFKRPSNLIFYRYIKEKIRSNLSNKRLVLLFLSFSLQLALCSFFWNRYILVYRELLESPSTNMLQARAKRRILKSNIMYFLIWFWRITNGHTFMQFFAGSIFLGKVLQFLELIKYVGFVEIAVLVTATELHILDVRNYLRDLAN